MLRTCLLLLILLFLSSALLPAQNRASFEADAGRACQLIETKRFGDAQRITDRLLRQATSLADAQALTDIGITFEDKGRYKEAEPFHRRALEINERQHGKNHPKTVDALTNLAINCKERGRYTEAEPLYKQALEITTKTEDDLCTALLMNNLAFLYQEQYRYDEAENLYQEALKLHGKRTDGKDDEYMASPLQNLARLYYFQSREAEPLEKQKLLEKAESFAKRALKIDEQSDPDHQDTGASLNMLGAVYSDQGAVYSEQKRFREAESLFKQAESFLQRALAIFEKRLSKNHPWAAECMHDLATLLERQGRYEEAEPLRNHTIDVYHQSGAEPHIGQDWYNCRAMLYKNTDRPQKAVADLKRAMDLSLEVHEHASGDEIQRAQTFSRYYNLFERMVDWQYKLGNMNEAYEAMERSRARTLLTIMMGHHIDLLVGVPEKIAQPLRVARDIALAEIAAAEKTDQTDDLKNARQKLAVAMAAMRSQSPAYQQMELIAHDTVRKELVTERSLALEYLVGDEKSYLLLYGLDVEPKLLPLVVDEKQAELFRVESGSLTAKKLMALLQKKGSAQEESVQEEKGVLQLIREKTPTGRLDTKTRDKLYALWTLLVPDEQVRTKIIDGKTFAKLLILPDGTLAQFPFEALVVEKDTENPPYLLDRGPTTVYAPSASMYYNLKILKTKSDKPRALTVGNPDYTVKRDVKPANTFRERHRSRRSARIGMLDSLPWTEKETEMIEASCRRNNISVTRLNLDQSTEENVRKNVSGQRIVHLACHGLAEDDAGNALFSTLALTIGDPNDPENDGFLDLAEMFELDLKSCELAILSACDTNIGLYRRGEGTWSIGRGMLASGAKRVVATNWSIDDKASAHLVRGFVDTINESSPPDYATALRNAKQKIRNSPDTPRWHHPYYWAPFVLIGPN